ncbi:zinc finger, C2H2 type, partial [Teladorsagia circumcincta]
WYLSLSTPQTVMDLPHEVVYHHHLPVETEEDMRMMEDQVEEHMDDIEYGGDVGMEGSMSEPRAVHQCNICNKIFVSFKGLQQHAVIHTDQKPYQCDICGKSFRFKSNLFEHRSVHTGFTPHSCPYCGKTCRLKGNLKKHLKTHVTSKDELERAWRPFAWKLGLGPDPSAWIDKIRRGEILPGTSIQTKICLKVFADRKSLEQHESYHKRVHLMIDNNEIEFTDPEILLPESCDFDEEELQGVPVIH